MRKWIGIFCIILGIACILGAVGLVAYNRWEEQNAETTAQDLLRDVQVVIDKPRPQPSLPEDREELPAEMPTAEVDGEDCVGILSVPALELELPVLADWSYARLRKAPCRYYGTCYETDFVIAAHNYKTHFGRLSQLQPGDAVIFTDVNGEDHCYEVVLMETLPPTATGEMITSGFDLSLYTCTPGGASRVTVRCTGVN